MEIAGIYKAQEDTIESLKKEIRTLKDENAMYSSQYHQLLERSIQREKQYEELVVDYNLAKIQKEFYKDKPNKCFSHVIQLTREQVYHLHDFIEDNRNINDLTLRCSADSGVSAIAEVKLDL